jgi:ribonuclease J
MHAFVAWSAKNVDHTVMLHRACLRSGRTLAVDLYTAEVMETLAAQGRLPRPGWPHLKVVITRRLARWYRRQGCGDFVDRMARPN